MKRTYRVNPETKELEEVTNYAPEWLIGGVRYGPEVLAEMKRKGLVPPSDFRDTWAKKQKEREAWVTKGGTPEIHEQRKQDIMEAVHKYNSGYRPPKRSA